MTSSLSRWIGTGARWVLGVSLVVFGLQHFAVGLLVTRIVPAGQGPWALSPGAVRPVGGLFLLLGALLLLRVWPRAVALVFSGVCLLSLVFLHGPSIAADVVWGGSWTGAGKALCFFSLGLLIAIAESRSRTPGTSVARRTVAVERAVTLARLLFAAFLILCGLQHFIWASFVQTLVPPWAGAPMFWTKAAGVGLILGGLGILVPRWSAAAAAVVGAVIFLWVWTLHVPRSITLRDANELTAVFEALSFVALAWLLSATQLLHQHNLRAPFVPAKA